MQNELKLQKNRHERQLELKSNFNKRIAIILQEQWAKQCQVEKFPETGCI